MRPRRTLVVADDDALHTELVAAWLEHNGYDVFCFHSGDELIGWAAEADAEVDGFLLDVDMPGRDGFESCRELRRLRRFSRTPAVFVTSMVDEAVESRASEVGAHGVLRKDPDLFRRLDDWLSSSLIPMR